MANGSQRIDAETRLSVAWIVAGLVVGATIMAVANLKAFDALGRKIDAVNVAPAFRTSADWTSQRAKRTLESQMRSTERAAVRSWLSGFVETLDEAQVQDPAR